MEIVTAYNNTPYPAVVVVLYKMMHKVYCTWSVKGWPCAGDCGEVHTKSGGSERENAVYRLCT